MNYYLAMFITGFLLPFIFKWIFKKLCYIDKSDVIECPISIEPVKVSKGNSIYRVNKEYIISGMDQNDLQSIDFIPEGFEFNGASIPSIFWDVIDHPYHSSYITAACIHDYRYSQIELDIDEYRYMINDDVAKVVMKKNIKNKYKEANREFRDNIRKYNRKIVSEIMYIGVNIYSNILCYFKLR